MAGRLGGGCVAVDLRSTPFPGVQPNARVIELSQRQPEFRRTLGDYVDVRASNKRVTNGRAAIRDHGATFSAVQSRYGVPAEIVCSIWGNETSYGTARGSTTSSRQWRRWPPPVAAPTSSAAS